MQQSTNRSVRQISSRPGWRRKKGLTLDCNLLSHWLTEGIICSPVHRDWESEDRSPIGKSTQFQLSSQMESLFAIIPFNCLHMFVCTKTTFHDHEFDCNLSHCSGVRVLMEKAWIDFNSSARISFTMRCLCRMLLPSKSGETIRHSNLAPHPSETSITSWEVCEKIVTGEWNKNEFMCVTIIC